MVWSTCRTAWCVTTVRTAWMTVTRTSVSTPLALVVSSMTASINRLDIAKEAVSQYEELKETEQGISFQQDFVVRSYANTKLLIINSPATLDRSRRFNEISQTIF